METRKCECHGRILVVDQDEWCRDFLTQVIKLLGMPDYMLVNTVSEALEVLGQSAFDLVITDHKMAEHQRLMDDARQRFPAMRFIVMMQRHASDFQFSYAEQVDTVVKPLSLDEMARKIREAIHLIHRTQVEEEFRRLKQNVFRFLA